MKNFWLRPLDEAVSKDTLRDTAKICSKLYEDSLVRGFIEDKTQYGKFALRPSMLGKPAIDIFGHRFFPELYGGDTKETRVKHILHMGNTWEADALFILGAMGIKVVDVQVETTWGEIKGSADAVIELEGKQFVAEFKSVNDNYFKGSWNLTLDCFNLPAHLAGDSIMKRVQAVQKQLNVCSELNDRRGYITQMAIYGEALKLPPLLFMLNKNDCNVLVAAPTPNELDLALTRATSICKAWMNVSCWDDVFQFIKPPPLRKEYKDKKWTGRYLLPISMYYSPVASLVYDILPDDDGKLVVLDYIYPEKFAHLKPELK